MQSDEYEVEDILYAISILIELGEITFPDNNLFILLLFVLVGFFFPF